jgi:pimeloyl-ACP methyl ester carboxylesterase
MTVAARIRVFTGSVLSGSALVLLLACADNPAIVSDGFVEVEEGIELYYRRVGVGPEIVVIPAGMYLEEEFKQLATHNRTLLFYDTRGRGKSTTITDATNLGIEYELVDLDILRQYFGFEHLSLVGWSYLGGVVVQYALRHPGRVERIIQIGSIPPCRRPYFDTYQATIAMRRDSSDLARLDSLRRAIKRGEDLQRNRQAYWQVLHKAMKYDQDVVLNFRSDYYTLENERPENVLDFHLQEVVGSLGNWDWRPELSKVEIPVLTIHGDYDALPLDGAREWADSLPNARLLIVPQAGHFPWAENPDVVFSAIDAFLKGMFPEL